MAIRIEDLPTALQSQVRRQLAAEDARRLPPTPAATAPKVVATSKPRGVPTKTEAAYRREVLDPNPAVENVWFEALTFRLANGHRYTPDWTFWSGGRLHCVEVKGSYRLGSYQRARLAFDQAAIEHPWAAWIWAERTKDGWETRPAPRQGFATAETGKHTDRGVQTRHGANGAASLLTEVNPETANA